MICASLLILFIAIFNQTESIALVDDYLQIAISIYTIFIYFHLLLM